MKQENRQSLHLSERQQKTISAMLGMKHSRRPTILEELMRPEQTNNYLPHELLPKKRKQKRHHL